MLPTQEQPLKILGKWLFFSLRVQHDETCVQRERVLFREHSVLALQRKHASVVRIHSVAMLMPLVHQATPTIICRGEL